MPHPARAGRKRVPHMHVHVHIVINTTKSLVDGSLLNPPPSPASHLISSLSWSWSWSLAFDPRIDIHTPHHLPITLVCSNERVVCLRKCVSSILILLFHVPTTPPPQPGPRDTDWLSTVKPPWQSWLPGLAECLTLKQPSRLLGSLRSRKLDPRLITTRPSSCPIIWLTVGDRYITALLPLTRLDSRRTPPALQHHQHSVQPTPAYSWASPPAPCPYSVFVVLPPIVLSRLVSTHRHLPATPLLVIFGQSTPQPLSPPPCVVNQHGSKSHEVLTHPPTFLGRCIALLQPSKHQGTWPALLTLVWFYPQCRTN